MLININDKYEVIFTDFVYINFKTVIYQQKPTYFNRLFNFLDIFIYIMKFWIACLDEKVLQRFKVEVK